MVINKKYLKWEYVKRFLDLLVIAGIIVAFFQFREFNAQTKIQSSTLENTRKVASAQFIYEIGKDVDNDHATDAVAEAINDNNGDYKILQPAGQFTESIVAQYISPYDTVGNLYNDDLITDARLTYDEFSNGVEKAYCNKDVQNLIKKWNSEVKFKSEKDSFYYGFETLARKFFEFDHLNCEALDKK